MVGEWGRGQRTRRVVILSEAKEPKPGCVMIHHEGTEATKDSSAGSHRFIPIHRALRAFVVNPYNASRDVMHALAPKRPPAP